MILPSCLDRGAAYWHTVLMKEVWQHNTVGDLHRRLRSVLRKHTTWTAADALALCPNDTAATINSCIQSMVRGKHVYRVSRGVYRMRGVV
jgi:hypothetical protein